MKKVILSAMVGMLMVMNVAACTDSPNARIKKGVQKFEGFTMDQKEQCGRYIGIATNIFMMKQAGRNLAEIKANIQQDKESSAELKASGVKIAELLYSSNYKYPDALIIGEVVCAEDMK